MKTTPVTSDDLMASVLAVPPLARRADLSLNLEENRRLVRHIEEGGVTTLMYGGNANFYNLPPSEFAGAVEFLADTADAASWVIPSVGPDYGRMIDQADTLRAMDFPTCMVLPLVSPATPEGVKRGVRRFVDRFGNPVILYVKQAGYLGPDDIAELSGDGLVCAIKYAIVRDDPGEDDYLRALVDKVDRSRVLSGMGERPAVVHLRDFGLASFTSGSVCVAPHAATRMLAALKSRDYARAEALRAAFLPLEDCRDAIDAVRVLHAAVDLAGIADMGPVLPLLHDLEEEHRPRVARAARDLLRFDQEQR
ncbi:MAG: dihydrodipicolinate synthase family protein [Alphaproteobacteria bacterium]